MIENLQLTPTLMVKNLSGLSTDNKPTDGVGTGSTFLEIDTGKQFIFSSLNVNPLLDNGWWLTISQTGGTEMVNINDIQESTTRVFVTPEQRDMIGSGGVLSVRAIGSFEGVSSTGLGQDFVASGLDSIALGNAAQALTDGALAVGKGAVAFQGVVGMVSSAQYVDSTHKKIIQYGNGPYASASVGDIVHISVTDGPHLALLSFEVSDVDGTGITIIVPEDFYFSGAIRGIAAATGEPYPSAAVGPQSQALAAGSTAIGIGVCAVSSGQTVVGKYNAVNKDDAFQIGGGSQASSANNLMSVDIYGNMKLKGDSITFGDGTVLGTVYIPEFQMDSGKPEIAIPYANSAKLQLCYVVTYVDMSPTTRSVYLMSDGVDITKLAGPEVEGFTLTNYADYVSTDPDPDKWNDRAYKATMTVPEDPNTYIFKLVKLL